MKRVFYTLPFLAFLIITGCHKERVPLFTAENMVSAQLNMNSAVGIMILSDTYNQATWYKTLNNRPVMPIQNAPETSSPHVYQVAISPNDDHIAVLSAGEGHPVIEIFEIENIFKQGAGCENTIDPISRIDPYPGTIWIEGWESEMLLTVGSDVPLDLVDRGEREALLENSEVLPQEFLWDIFADTITRR